ncbi:MAG: glycosyltransferase [Ferruginibacter sp.]
MDLSIRNKTILIAPLDWGLGHVTRCIPIIQQLIDQGNRVLVATDPRGAVLIKETFPAVTILPLNGYGITYARNRAGFLPHLLRQFFRSRRCMNEEHRLLKNWVSMYSPDLIISDNRPGFFHPTVPSVYITHQLYIRTGFSLLDRLAQTIHYRYIQSFNACWVPDLPHQHGWAGRLSHPKKMPSVPVTYIGPISRFKPLPSTKKYRIAFVLSGPEPQRSILEAKILDELRSFSDPVLLVRGLPDNTKPLSDPPPNLTVFNHLQATDLNQAMADTEILVLRSGYSSIMDLAAMHRTAILIPTPGQTEQEYLAEYLSREKGFPMLEQKAFSIQALLALHQQGPSN